MAGWAVFQKECLTFLRKDTKIPTMEKEIKINLGACLYLVFFILLGLKLAGLISAPWWVIMTPLILLFITSVLFWFVAACLIALANRLLSLKILTKK